MLLQHDDRTPVRAVTNVASVYNTDSNEFVRVLTSEISKANDGPVWVTDHVRIETRSSNEAYRTEYTLRMQSEQSLDFLAFVCAGDHKSNMDNAPQGCEWSFANIPAFVRASLRV